MPAMQQDKPEKNSADRQCILLFTRFPEPGQVKTRMIPALGPQGACDLHTRLTQKVLANIDPALAQHNIKLHIMYDGGSQQKMKDWLGDDRLITPQQGSDLGRKMIQALTLEASLGSTHILLIGSDCPDINAEIILEGFDKLNNHELVLGPAVDGGYYLIGLQMRANRYQNLFCNIDWGDKSVLQQTLNLAKHNGYSCSLLPTLHDIDRPEDLVHFDHHTCS